MLIILAFVFAYSIALQIAISGIFPPTTPAPATNIVGVVNLVEAPATASGTTGLLILVQSGTSSEVTIRGRISNLSAGMHGFHVHTTGATTSNCADAGSHFDPTNMNHGSPTSSTRHVGDLGNIVSTSSTGITTISITDSIISLREGNAANILGRSIVVHANADDGVSTASAGARQSCGIIETCDSTCQQTFSV